MATGTDEQILLRARCISAGSWGVGLPSFWCVELLQTGKWIELLRCTHLKCFLPLFDTLYGSASVLFYEDFSELLSEEGSQQGCPLGGLLFV